MIAYSLFVCKTFAQNWLSVENLNLIRQPGFAKHLAVFRFVYYSQKLAALADFTIGKADARHLKSHLVN